MPPLKKTSRPDRRPFIAAAALLKQASDPTRLQVLGMLAEGEKHVGAICAQMNMSQPAVSHHLALLRHGGLIQLRRAGKENHYSLTEKGQRLWAGVEGVLR